MTSPPTRSSTPAHVLQARGLSVSIGSQSILEQVDITVSPGELVAVIGPNGSGKTTLLRTLSGVLAPARGTISLSGAPLADLGRRAIARELAYLPQDTSTSFSVLVRDLVSLGRFAHAGALKPLSRDDREAIEEAMREADVHHLAERTVPTLSGGERRRAYLARVLAQGAPTLVLDEPVSALDIGHAFRVLDLLRRWADAGRAVLFSLHDLSLAVRGVDRLVLLDGGRKVAEGPPGQVIPSAATEQAFGLKLQIVAPDGSPPTITYRLPTTS